MLKTFRAYWRAYFPKLPNEWAIISVLAGLMVFALLQWKQNKNKTMPGLYRKRLASLGGGFAVGYVVMIYAMLVVGRNSGNIRRYILKPFWSYQGILNGSRDLIFENLFNVLLFIPLGASVYLFISDGGRKPSRKFTFVKTVVIGMLLSFVVELLQFWTATGLAEFDDVFHNTLGTAMGAGFMILVLKIVARVAEKKQVDSGGG